MGYFLIGFSVLALIISIIIFLVGDENTFEMVVVISILIACILFPIGCLTGFWYYPKTEGTHQGIVTAVDLEGIFFRRYEIYIKSGGYSKQNDGTMSDETKYLLYESETDLKNELQDLIGQEVKINYGHDGGFIPWNSCGTYHIKSVEKVEN